MHLSDLLKNLADISDQAASTPIGGMSDNSRAIKPGDMFAALAGSSTDGRIYIEAAVSAGASAILTDMRPLEAPLDDLGIPIVMVENPRHVLAKAAARFWRKQPGMIAAVTGTNGKTSTTDFLRQLWTRVTWQAASIGTLGVKGTDTRKMDGKILDLPKLTTPDSVSLHSALSPLCNAGVTHLALEASSHGLLQQRLDGLNVHIAAFTNLTQDHLDHHGDMESYFIAKSHLFMDLLMHAGAAIINIDDPYGRRLCKMLTAQSETRQIVIKTFGFADDADFQIETITPIDNILEMSVKHEGLSWHIPLAMSGTFQAVNALTAAIMAHMSGLPLQDSLGALAFLKPAPGRMQTVTGHPKGAQIVVDFAHTPDALRAALEALRPEVSNKLYVLFGCGGDRDPSKRALMGAIAGEVADEVIITDDNPRSEDPASIRADIMAASPKSIEIIPRDTAIKTALEQLESGDVLLIAGKGHEVVQLIGDETLPFSDISVASRIIADMVEAHK